MISTSPEPLRRLVADIMQEHARTVAKFPGPNVNMTALTEEVGELADALTGYLVGLTAAQGRLARVLLHFRPDDGGDSTWADVRKEAVQVAVMALRVALEGDSTLAQPDGADALQVAPSDTPAGAVVAYAIDVKAFDQLMSVTGDVLAFLDLVRRDAWENRHWVQDRAGELQTGLELARFLAKRGAEHPSPAAPAGGELAHDWRPATRGGKVCASCREYRPADLQPGDIVAYHTVSYNGVPPRREPIHYQPDEVCHGPAASPAAGVRDHGVQVVGPDLVENRSHVAMDRFPRRGEVLTLRVVHWREGVERYPGNGDLYHLERLDEDTGKWRETNPPLDWSCGSMADLLAKVTAWTREHGVGITWVPKVYASETDRLLAPVTVSPGVDHSTMHKNVMDILDRSMGFMNATLHGGTLNHDEIMRAVERIIQVRKDLTDAATMDTASAAGSEPANPYKNGEHAVNNALWCLRAIREGFERGEVSLAPGGEQTGNYAHVCDAISWLENHPQVRRPPTAATPEPAGAAIRVDGELFTDVQIRAMVDQVRDFMRDGANVELAGKPSDPTPGDKLATAPAQLEPGTVIISGVTRDRRFTATLEPGAEQYHLVVNDGEIITDGTLAQVLQTICLLPPDEPAMKITTPRGLCRIEKVEGRADEEAWRVEQFDGKRWQEIASRISYKFAMGVYIRRMKECFPTDEYVTQLGKEIDRRYVDNYKQRHDKVRETFTAIETIIRSNGGVISEKQLEAIRDMIHDTTNALHGF